MVGNEIFAGLGEQTLFGGTDTGFQLFFTGGLPKIGRGAAHVVDIALEIRFPGHLTGFGQNRLMASGLDNSALMERQSAEAAPAEAAAAGHQTEPHFLNGGDAAGLFIGGVIGAHVGQTVNPVHLPLGKGLLGRILHHKFFRPVGFHQCLAGKGVRVAILSIETLGILPLVFAEFLIGGQDLVGHRHRGFGGTVYSTVHKSDISGMEAAVEGFRHLHNGPLAHAVQQQIRLGIQQNGAFQLVGPVIVMGQTAQTGFDAADDNGNIMIDPANQIAIDHRGIVGPLAHDAAGGKGVVFAALLGDGVVIDHGIHIAAGDEEPQAGTAQGRDGLGVLPVGLGQNADFIAVGFQNPADDGMAEGRMIHIGIADDIDKIALLPAAGIHVGLGNGQKFTHDDSSCIRISQYSKEMERIKEGSGGKTEKRKLLLNFFSKKLRGPGAAPRSPAAAGEIPAGRSQRNTSSVPKRHPQMAQSPAKPKAAVPTLLRVVGGGLFAYLYRRRGQAPTLRGGTHRPCRQWSICTGGGTHRSCPTFYVGSLFVAVGRGILDAPNLRPIRGRQGCRPLRGSEVGRRLCRAAPQEKGSAAPCSAPQGKIKICN